MYALLENGPLGKQQIETADTPPQVLHRQTRFATHVYHLVGVEELHAPRASDGFERRAVYTFAGDLPQAA